MIARRGPPVQPHHYDLSGLGLRLSGASSGWDAVAVKWWAPFEVSALAQPVIDARVRDDPSAVRRPGAPLTCERVDEAADGAWVRFRTPEGEARVAADGDTGIVLGPGEETVRGYALMNLLLAALAWRLPALGLAVFHAAVTVVDGRAFVLVGASGSGKSTFSRCAREGGALSLSEDLAVLDTSGEAVDALSVPFRADELRPAGPGRWPLAAVLLPERGPDPELRAVDRMRARAALAANLPHASGSIRNATLLEQVMERVLSAVPVRTLRFRPDGSFLPLLAALAGQSR